MAIGGLDIGSTGTKLTVLNLRGQTLYTGYRDYPVKRNMGEHEINAADIWDVVQELLREAIQAAPNLSAVGVTSFGESFVLLDANDEVLSPTMMYTDPRGEAEANILREKLGDELISAVAGTIPHPMYSLPKLMWVKAHKPDVFANTRYVLLIGDYLVYKLTGERIIDYSMAARTMGFDIVKKEWSSELFSAAELDPALFSKPVPTGTCAGNILPCIAKALGLPENLRVVFCGQDQVAAAVGSNVIKPGMATDGGGSVQCMTPVFSHMPEGGALQANHYPVVPFLDGGAYCCYAYSFAGGSLVKWFVERFCAQYRIEAKERGITAYGYMEEKMRDEPTGILVLPHFLGAATPYMDTGSRGAFAGLDLTHGPIELFRAIMEGITYEMRLNMEKLKESGIKISGLNATGGCAKSKLWLQMKADILGVPITKMSVDEAGTIGGIMLTGVATGVYSSLEEASYALVRAVDVYHPRKEAQEKYDAHYGRYRRLYEAVRPLMD